MVLFWRRLVASRRGCSSLSSAGATDRLRTLLRSAEWTSFLGNVRRNLEQAQGGHISAPSTSVARWQSICDAATQLSACGDERSQLSELLKDNELRALATADLEQLDGREVELMKEIAESAVVNTEYDLLDRCQLEFTSGAGGTEAMLFNGELLEAYRLYAARQKWEWTVMSTDSVPLGGVRSAVVGLCGRQVYAKMRLEAGVHRVQRNPVTDPSRVHTSTISLAVLPEPAEVSVVIPSSSVKIETMRASGPGGQNVNKRSTAVRITHKETGISVHIMEERFQHLNLQIAYKRLAAIIMQQQEDKLLDQTSSNRRIQMGSRARAEKIRTYNWKDDRVTDHRIRQSVFNLSDYLAGGDSMQRLLDAVAEEHFLDRLQACVACGAN